jgi:hypothetical protein
LLEKTMVIMFALVSLNFLISAYNAYACGVTWASTSKAGGLAHFTNWMGAIMSASGFTWCYTMLMSVIGVIIPIKGDDGVYHPLLTSADAEMVLNLGYLVVIFPIIGSGLALMLRSWQAFAQDRSLGNGAVAGWNTFAQAHNTYNAISTVPDVFGKVAGLFSSKGENNSGKLILAMVALALVGGIATTFAIVKWAANSQPRTA